FANLLSKAFRHLDGHGAHVYVSITLRKSDGVIATIPHFSDPRKSRTLCVTIYRQSAATANSRIKSSSGSGSAGRHAKKTSWKRLTDNRKSKNDSTVAASRSSRFSARKSVASYSTKRGTEIAGTNILSSSRKSRAPDAPNDAKVSVLESRWDF